MIDFSSKGKTDSVPVGSITHWIEEVKRGNDAGAREIWGRYFQRLVRLARRRVSTYDFVLEDEEDVALSVLARFCRSAEAGDFPKVSSRNALWIILVRMTIHKLIGRHRHQMALCRRPQGAKSYQYFSEDQVIDKTPGPEFFAIMEDQFQTFFESLQKPELRQVLVWKMEGRTSEEISDELDCSVRTVERMVRHLRLKLESHGVSDD